MNQQAPEPRPVQSNKKLRKGQKLAEKAALIVALLAITKAII